jgi:hypothetical protein
MIFQNLMQKKNEMRINKKKTSEHGGKKFWMEIKFHHQNRSQFGKLIYNFYAVIKSLELGVYEVHT